MSGYRFPHSGRLRAHPADRGLDLARASGGSPRHRDHGAATGVEVVREPSVTAMGGNATLDRAVRTCRCASIRVGAPVGQHGDLVARRAGRRRRRGREAAVVVGAHHPLDGEAHVVEVAVAGDLDGLEVAEQRRPVPPRQRSEGVDDVVALQRGDRDRARRRGSRDAPSSPNARLDLAEARPRPSRRGPSC